MKVIDREVLDKAKDWMRENLHPRASSLRGTPDYKREAMGGMLEILLKKNRGFFRITSNKAL